MSMKPTKDVHVLYIPAWLPTADNPFGGIFILDQVKAIQNYTPAHVGIIFRQDLTLNKKHNVLDSHLAPFNHVVVRKPYMPKANTTTIKLWCNQYLDAFDQYVDRYGTPDIIHAHSYIAGFAARYISRKNGIPYVLTEHLTTFIDQNIKKAHVPILKKVLSEAACVIAVSDFLREAIKPYTTRPIDVIPNLFDEQIFLPSSISIKEPFTIVAIGDLIPRKGFDVLIKAFKIACGEVDGMYLAIVGTGQLRHELEDLVASADLESFVTFHGPCSNREIAAILQASQLCISTSHVETFGITIIEAMGCGVPVIATPSGGPNEVITAQTGIQTSDSDPVTIAASIVKMKRNYANYKSEKIAEYAVGKYGSKVVTGLIFDVYQNILSK